MRHFLELEQIAVCWCVDCQFMRKWIWHQVQGQCLSFRPHVCTQSGALSHYSVSHILTSNIQERKDSIDLLRDSASSFHWLSSSIFSCCCLVGCPASVTSPLISTIWCFRAYKPYIFCEDVILAACQCQHIFYCWVEPSLLLSILNCILKKFSNDL